jgi:uncharacterized membrane protein YbhN (UPF0104 family)
MAFVEPEPGAPGSDAEGADDERRSFLARILATRQRKGNPWLLVVAIAIFVVFTAIAFRALPPIERPIRWELIAVAVVCVPITTVLNSFEYRVMAHFADHHPPVLEIVKVSIMGAAANLLPVPGAVVVRLADLRKGGVKVGRGLNLTAIVGLTWVGSAWMLGGIASLAGHPRFGAAALALGVSLMTVSLILLSRVLQPGNRLAGSIELLAIEAAFVSIQAFRLFLVASALRFDVTIAQTSVLVIASVSAAAIGFLPAGLGAREALAALLSPIVGIPAAVGLVITAVDRLVSLVSLSVLSVVVTVVARRQRRAAETT